MKLKKRIAVLLVAVMLMAVLPVQIYAADEIPLDAAHFPDDHFREALAELDTDQNGSFSQSEISAVTELNVAGKEISNLQGIEHLTSVQTLNCERNNLETLDLTANQELTVVKCNRNSLKSLSVTPKIEEIWINANFEFTQFDLTPLTNLKKFGAANTKLSEIDVTSCPELLYLGVQDTPVQELNLSQNSKLDTLMCGNTEVRHLDLTNNPELTDLTCGNLQLTELDLSHQGKLKNLSCDHNELTELDLSNNPELYDLDCSSNQLQLLDLRSNPKLNEVTCEKNHLTSLQIEQCAVLRNVTCYQNQLTKLDLSGNPELAELTCYENRLEKLDLSQNPKLRKLMCSNNRLTELDISAQPKCTTISCDDNQLVRLIIGARSTHFKLYCNNNCLTSLDLSKIEDAGTIQLDGNRYLLDQRTGFDYTTLPVGFDIQKVSQVQGGSFDVENHTFSFNDDVTEATYVYDTGLAEHSATFTLYTDIPAPDAPDPDVPDPDVPDPDTPEAEIKFSDVPEDAYYAEPVRWAVSKGVTSGTTSTTFSPNLACTRAQIVTFLWSACGKPQPHTTINPFRDAASDDWYSTAMLWAVESGVTSGTSATTFSPDKTCTRAEAVTFLYQVYGEETVYDGSFHDVSSSDWYATSVAWAVANGITSGMGNDSFGPNDKCNRAQIVTFLYKANGN